MFNRNALKSALIFLGIIFIVVVANLFFMENEFLVKSDDDAVANVACSNVSNEVC